MSVGSVSIGSVEVQVTLTEFQDDDGNKKACDVIARINTLNSDGVSEAVTVRYDSTTTFSQISNYSSTIWLHSGTYRTQIYTEEKTKVKVHPLVEMEREMEVEGK